MWSSHDFLLWCGYGAAMVLCTVHFVWETGPLHSSRFVESRFLHGVMVLIYATSFVWVHWGGVYHDALPVRRLQRLLVLMLVLQNSVRMRVHAPEICRVGWGGNAMSVSQPQSVPGCPTSRQ
mmetsp:Transcript_14181/g.49860  ORF Transcript_14181/g.49860 Transcript_14181/m.49860 type:complete len:122 (+) Transcript_14181:38-403(+)